MKYKIRTIRIPGGNENIIGMATLILDEQLIVRDILIVKDSEEIYCIMPRYKSSGAKKYLDICHIECESFYNEIKAKVIHSMEMDYAEVEGEFGQAKLSIQIAVIKRDEGTLKGNAKLNIAGLLTISNIGIIESKNGVFVSMPKKKTNRIQNDGKPKYKTICFPTNESLRRNITSQILELYKNMTNKNHKNSNVPCFL